MGDRFGASDEGFRGGKRDGSWLGIGAGNTRVVARHVFVVCECVLPWTAIETNYYVFSRTVCQFPVESAYSRHLRRIEGWIFH